MAEEPTASPAPETTADILDQSEIDRLIAQAVEAPKQQIYRADGRKAPAPKIDTYDFRNPIFLTEAELRSLRMLHEDFIRYLSARLSLFLRMECALKMAKLTTLAFAKFSESLPNPTHLCLFKADPLLGVGILDLNPRLALSMVDRMLGGRGNAAKLERHLTEIEITMLEDVILIILEEWCGQWKSEKELNPSIIGHDNNGRFLQTSPKDAVVLALTVDVNFGECMEQMQVGVPYAMIEPLVKTMQARRARHSAPESKPRKPEWKPVYEHVSIPARAEWEAFELTLRELSHLRVGDVIELPSEIVDHTIVTLNNSPKFSGTVGLDSDRVVVKLTKKITSENPAHAKPSGR